MTTADSAHPIDPYALRPYISLLFLQCVTGQEELAFDKLSELLRKARERRDHSANILVGAEISGISGFLRHGLEARGVDQISGFIHRIESNPSWAIPGAQYIDIRHALSIALRRGQIFAIHCDSSTRAVLARWLKREPRPPLRQVSQNIVQGAFLRGEAKGLWLHGTHVRSAIRPDTKHITGMRVQDALSGCMFLSGGYSGHSGHAASRASRLRRSMVSWP